MLAITALGANLTYGVWFARANAEPAFAPVALRTIKFIDDRIANPAYGLLLPIGALMVWVGGLSFATLWVAAGMGLWFVAVIIAATLFSPTLREHIAAVERDGAHSPKAVRLAKRGQAIAAILGIAILAILALMVFKPA